MPADLVTRTVTVVAVSDDDHRVEVQPVGTRPRDCIWFNYGEDTRRDLCLALTNRETVTLVTDEAADRVVSVTRPGQAAEPTRCGTCAFTCPPNLTCRGWTPRIGPVPVAPAVPPVRPNFPDPSPRDAFVARVLEAWDEAVAQKVAAERERCARIVESEHRVREIPRSGPHETTHLRAALSRLIATRSSILAAIRNPAPGA